MVAVHNDYRLHGEPYTFWLFTDSAGMSYKGEGRTDADALNVAHSYGVQLGYKAWAFTWSYEEVQKDAVVGLFTDSDFGGGVTSSRGQVWSLAYKFTKKVTMQYTVYNNENAIDVAPTKYDRSHLDLSMTF